MAKRRKSATEVESMAVIGDIRGKNVLLVDDLTETAGTLTSAATLLKKKGALTASRAIEVVGVARDGLEALEKIAELKPDVATLDLIMPNLDGLGVLRALPHEGAPAVVIVSISDSNSALGIEALQMGAVDLVQKPTALATDRLYELSGELVAKVLAAGRSHPRLETGVPEANRITLASKAVYAGVKLIVVGASTGGPQALTRLLGALPADLPCAVAVALHIPSGYTETLAARLNGACAVHVFEASEGAQLLPGSVAIARGGSNLRIRNANGVLTTHIDNQPTASRFSPSVDVLLESATMALGPAVLGVILTGMGNDGLEGARALSRAGGRILTESEASCVVYGMPRAIAEAGLSTAHAPIERMAQAILNAL